MHDIFKKFNNDLNALISDAIGIVARKKDNARTPTSKKSLERITVLQDIEDSPNESKDEDEEFIVNQFDTIIKRNF